MPLLTFWRSSRSAVEEMTIEQIVASAGDGVLKDNSKCSQELREFLKEIPSGKISDYVDHCLTSSFVRGGLVLQDLVNELGRRLDFEVTSGRYQGSAKSIGFDGLWVSPEGHTIVAEVKTTDAYRISLDKIIDYRDKLLETSEIRGRASVLILVGREDTGELEAQVRGSRHAWDVRLISIDALARLVQMKEQSESIATSRKIRNLLTPMEYTRLDQMIDVMFTTATDVQSVAVSEAIEAVDELAVEQPDVKTRGVWKFTDSRLLDEARERIVASFSHRQNVSYIRKGRALYWDSSHTRRVYCAVSKRYERKDISYWYGYRLSGHKFLGDGQESFLILGGMDLSLAFAVPWPVISRILNDLYTTPKDPTPKDEDMYWHLHLRGTAETGYVLNRPKQDESLSVDQFKFELR